MLDHPLSQAAIVAAQQQQFPIAGQISVAHRGLVATANTIAGTLTVHDTLNTSRTDISTTPILCDSNFSGNNIIRCVAAANIADDVLVATVGYDNKLRIWSFMSQATLYCEQCSGDNAYAVAFGPSLREAGKPIKFILATGGADKKVCFWTFARLNQNTVALLATDPHEKAHSKHVLSIAFTKSTTTSNEKEDIIAATGGHKTICVWRGTFITKAVLHRAFEVHQSSVRCLKWDRSCGLLYSGGSDYRVCVSDPLVGTVRDSVLQTAEITAIAVFPENRFATSTMHGTVAFWAVTDRSDTIKQVELSCTRTVQVTPQAIYAAACYDGVTVVVGDQQGTVFFLDSRTMAVKGEPVPRACGDNCYSVAVHANLVFAVGKQFGVFALQTGELVGCVKVPSSPSDAVRAMEFSHNADELIVRFSSGKTIALTVNAKTKQLLPPVAAAAAAAVAGPAAAAAAAAAGPPDPVATACSQCALLRVELAAMKSSEVQLKARVAELEKQLSAATSASDYVLKSPYAFDPEQSSVFSRNVPSNARIVLLSSLLGNNTNGQQQDQQTSSSNTKLLLGAPVPQFVRDLWQRGGLRLQRPVHGFELVRFDAIFRDVERSEQLLLTAAKDRQLSGQRKSGIVEFNSNFDALPPVEREAKKSLLRVLKSCFQTPYRVGQCNWLFSFHGCSANAVASIIEHGLFALHRQDGGFFAGGIYSSPSVEYAARYASAELSGTVAQPANATNAPWAPVGCFPVLLLSCGISHCYPITYETDVVNPKARGETVFHSSGGAPSKALKPGSDAHFAAVSEGRNFLCAPQREADYFELVQNHSEMCVPMGIVWVKRSN